ncbi:MAG: nucleoside-diphosphate kinase [Bacteroidales bacterium]|jgi:nucleoside-diphosphate kinase|nr:nucleoside-diphosphate kinase [Bacteroidales bacterium]
MAGNITFTMIKPDAVKNGHIGNILKMITDAGFRIVAMKFTRMSAAKASKFYDIHQERPFFGELVEFMTSGPIVAAVLQKENAVEEFRKLIGATNPANAEEGTIRKLYATSLGENAIHGADSDENALREGSFHFATSEWFDANGNCLG